jgi:dihydroorotate dehydrogenase (NAD+) catalytic subunit
MNLSARISNLEINPAIMNASGIISFLPSLKRISDYLGALVLKSIGYEERNGNETPILTQVSNETYINAVGLSGPGYKNLRKELEESNFKLNKPLGISLFADSPNKLTEMIKYLQDYCDFFELNFSCPNLIGEEKIGIEIGRDHELVKRYTNAARESTEKIIIPKLSPAPYIEDRKKFVNIAKAAESEGADAISAINTVPGGMKIDIYAKRPILTAKYGGVSGKSIKPIGVGCVYTLYESVSIPIIGAGGIETAKDILEYIEAGANSVQIGTGLIGGELSSTTKEINRSLSVLIKNLEDLLQEMGVDSLNKLIGVAHV